MKTNIDTNRTPSLVQPPSKTRAEYFKMFDELLKDADDIQREMVRKMDKNAGVGYFAEKEQPELKYLNEFKTQNPLMLALKEKVKLLVHQPDTILIYGESGTGKELIAKALHGDRPPSTFIGINCSGLPESLIEAELFGYEEGSFTGGRKGGKAGLFQEAGDGTLFLDEIGELPLAMQAKLLRVLQERAVRRVGGVNLEPIKCRFVCATHQNLEEDIEQKKFRLDLYYRISTIILQINPLRERPEDIPLIVRELDQSQLFPSAFNWHQLITKTGLKGNVRELQQIVRRHQLFKELPQV